MYLSGVQNTFERRLHSEFWDVPALVTGRLEASGYINASGVRYDVFNRWNREFYKKYQILNNAGQYLFNTGDYFIDSNTKIMIFNAVTPEVESIIAGTVNGGDPYSDGSQYILGWQFTLTGALNITHLGAWAENDLLTNTTQVGIYRMSDQSLLIEEVVPQGSAGELDSGFRFKELASPYTLSTGQYMTVCTTYGATTDNTFLLSVTSNTINSLFTNNAWFLDSGPGGSDLAIPTTSASELGAAGASGLWGPNMKFTI